MSIILPWLWYSSAFPYVNKKEPYDVLACSYRPAFVWAQTRLKDQIFVKNRTGWLYRLGFMSNHYANCRTAVSMRHHVIWLKSYWMNGFVFTDLGQRKFANPFLPPKWSAEHYCGFDISFIFITVQALKLLKHWPSIGSLHCNWPPVASLWSRNYKVSYTNALYAWLYSTTTENKNRREFCVRMRASAERQ